MHHMRNHPPKPSENFRLVAMSADGGPDGRIGLLYERGGRSAYERLTFAKFPLTWLSYSEADPAPR
jgi:hypothetical protein